MGLTVFPSGMARGATYSDMYAFLAAHYTAKELRSVGITMNFAPVLDVNTNPRNPIIGLRSFGDSPEEVASLGAIAVEGSRRGRVAAVAKHFPGHGDTASDSHRSLPIVAHSWERLQRVELEPFRAAIKAGVPAIMTAHVAYPALDPLRIPATLSKPILTDLLRGKLGFRGVIVTDSLDMRAITARWSLPEASVLALDAGADLLLIGSGTLEAVYDKILESLEEGRLSLETLQQASDRILVLKKRLGLPGEDLKLSPEDRKRIRRLAIEIAERSVTVLEDGDGLLPLSHYRAPLLILFVPPGFSSDIEVLERAFKKRLTGTSSVVVGPEPSSRQTKEVLAHAADADFLLIGTFHWSRSRYKRQVALVERLLNRGPPAVLVSLMNPFDQSHFEASTRIATYGITPSSMHALAKVLLGQIRPRGLLPVQISSPSK